MHLTTAPTSARPLVEQAAIERLLNAFLRERGLDRPHLLDPAYAPRALRSIEQGQPVRLDFPAAGQSLFGTLAYVSSLGYHRYGDHFWVGDADGARVQVVRGAAEVASIVLAELGATEADLERRRRLQGALLEQVTNSVAKTTRYVQQRLEAPESGSCLDDASPFLACEQSLCFGHPFHPTPKSAEGFSDDDLARYAPELGACFPLHWFAASPQLVVDLLADGGAQALEAVERTARGRLGQRWADRGLLPAHPWQARHLLADPAVGALVSDGRLVPLGPLGPPVHPTSSVRTVWDPASGLFLKLALNVRITNFVRVNPPEQLRRSIDASRVVQTVAPRIRHEGLTILPELAGRSLHPEDDDDGVPAGFGVLAREAPPIVGSAAPMVLAGLLEEDPGGGTPPLVRAVHRAADAAEVAFSDAFLCAWLTRYLQLFLAPLLRLAVEGGVSLEAHAQNALVSLDRGWPVHCYVRDLEGASCNRAHPLARSGFLVNLPPDSPVLYCEEEAWQRLSYYVLVNHLGQLIATLARYHDHDEAQLWSTVRGVVANEMHRLRRHSAAGPFRDLLTRDWLPAKANLLSRFHERGERPLYVPIPNPLRPGPAGDTPAPPGPAGDTPAPLGPAGDTPAPPGPAGDTPAPLGPAGDTPAPPGGGKGR